MISYLLLHYNRPYLLDINIRLLRKYLPPGSQIVVADDGSHPDAVKRIGKFEIDDLFVQKENKNQWVEGTCSNTIAAGRKLLKNKFVVFSEDDFFFCPNPVDDRGFAQWEIMPAVSYKTDAPCTFFEEAQKLLSEKKAKNVQMARDDYGWRAVPVNGEFTTDNYKWKFIDHIKKNRFYYSNWPSMMRTASYREIPMAANKAIWNFEGSFSKSVRRALRQGQLGGGARAEAVHSRRHAVLETAEQLCQLREEAFRRRTEPSDDALRQGNDYRH
jgi:glycosyltransferase involved in cell wall biosynthesis